MTITELASGEILQRVPLPGVGQLCRLQDLLWSAGCQSVVVRFGDEWALHSGQMYSDHIRIQRAGLVFVGLATHTCQVVDLPCQRRLILAGHPLQCALSCSTGHLALLHVDAQQQLALSVYSAAGRPLVSIRAPALREDLAQPARAWLRSSQLSWCPAGQLLSYWRPDTSFLCIWRPTASHGVQQIELDSRRPLRSRLVWSPCSAQLLVQLFTQPSIICTLDGHLTRQPAEQACLFAAAWGLKGVIGFVEYDEQDLGDGCWGSFGCRGLVWHPVRDDCLAAAATTVDLSRRRLKDFTQAAVSSPTGEHFACVTWRLQGRRHGDPHLGKPDLEVVHSVQGRVFQQSVECLSGSQSRSLFSSPILSWGVDGTQLVASTESGDMHVIVNFA